MIFYFFSFFLTFSSALARQSSPESNLVNCDNKEWIQSEESYPVSSVTFPPTSFTCYGRHDGYYADTEVDCTVFHYCQTWHFPTGRNETVKWDFFCPQSTIFNQELLSCVPPNRSFDCKNSPDYYWVNYNLHVAPEKSPPSQQIACECDNKNNTPDKEHNLSEKPIDFPVENEVSQSFKPYEHGQDTSESDLQSGDEPSPIYPTYSSFYGVQKPSNDLPSESNPKGTATTSSDEYYGSRVSDGIKEPRPIYPADGNSEVTKNETAPSFVTNDDSFNEKFEASTNHDESFDPTDPSISSEDTEINSTESFEHRSTILDGIAENEKESDLLNQVGRGSGGNETDLFDSETTESLSTFSSAPEEYATERATSKFENESNLTEEIDEPFRQENFIGSQTPAIGVSANNLYESFSDASSERIPASAQNYDSFPAEENIVDAAISDFTRELNASDQRQTSQRDQAPLEIHLNDDPNKKIEPVVIFPMVLPIFPNLIESRSNNFTETSAEQQNASKVDDFSHLTYADYQIN